MKKLILFILFLTLGCESKIANVKKEVFESTLIRPIDNLATEYRLTSFFWKEGVTSDDVASVTQILYKLQELSMQRLSVRRPATKVPNKQPEKDDGALRELDENIEELQTLLRSKVDWIGESKIIFDITKVLFEKYVGSTGEDKIASDTTETAQDQAMGVMLIGFNPSQLTEPPIFTTEKRPSHIGEDADTLYESIQEVSYDPKGGRIRFLVHFDNSTYEFHLETVEVLKGRPLFSGQLILYQNEKPIKYGVLKTELEFL